MNWVHLASTPVTLDDERQSRRIVGGGLWIADAYLDEADDSHEDVPEMLVYGYKILGEELLRTLHP